MAFRETWEYSKIDHVHDYNYAICKPTYQISDFEDPNDISCICEVLTSNSTERGVVSILYPPLKKTKPVVSDIGEFRLYAAKNTKTATQIRNDIDNGTFDGWVYADGGQYGKTQGKYDFTEAFLHYDGTGTTFNVPMFQDFLRLNGTPSGIDEHGYDKVLYRNRLVAHKHSLNPYRGGLVGSRVTIELTLCGDHADKSGNKGLHLRFDATGTNYKMTKITADIDIDDASATGTMKYSNDSVGENLDVETKPRHYILPGMVYIGVKLK